MIDWDDSPSLEAAGKIQVSVGFSKFHAKLLDICFGDFNPDTEIIEALHGDTIEYDDLKKLAYMVLVEFAASVEKERQGTQEETHVKPEPRPYDVFVMKTDFGQQLSNISVLLPMRGGQLQWWNGQKDLSPIRSGQHVYRIASLSGAARVLDALDRARTSREPLCRWAMRREMLVSVEQGATMQSVAAPSFINSVRGVYHGNMNTGTVETSILDPLNDSQRKAVETVAGAKFRDGFFAIQGYVTLLSASIRGYQ